MVELNTFDDYVEVMGYWEAEAYYDDLEAEAEAEEIRAEQRAEMEEPW